MPLNLVNAVGGAQTVAIPIYLGLQETFLLNDICLRYKYRQLKKI